MQLCQNFVGLQISLQSHGASCAKGASLPAAKLRGDTKCRERSGRVRDDDCLNLVERRQLDQQFARAAARDCRSQHLIDDRLKGLHEGSPSLAAQLIRGERITSAAQNFPDLPASSTAANAAGRFLRRRREQAGPEWRRQQRWRSTARPEWRRQQRWCSTARPVRRREQRWRSTSQESQHDFP